MKAARRGLAAAALILLAGCAGLRSERPGAVPAASGRLGVAAPGQSFSGRFEWRGTARDADVMLLSPLGTGLARLSLADGRARLDMADGRHYEAADAEALTGRLLGWPLPVATLARLLAAPEAPSADYEDHGWRVSETAPAPGGPLRLKVDLRRGDVRIRVLVDARQDGGPAPRP